MMKILAILMALMMASFAVAQGTPSDPITIAIKLTSTPPLTTQDLQVAIKNLVTNVNQIYYTDANGEIVVDGEAWDLYSGDGKLIAKAGKYDNYQITIEVCKQVAACDFQAKMSDGLLRMIMSIDSAYIPTTTATTITTEPPITIPQKCFMREVVTPSNETQIVGKSDELCDVQIYVNPAQDADFSLYLYAVLAAVFGYLIKKYAPYKDKTRITNYIDRRGKRKIKIERYEQYTKPDATLGLRWKKVADVYV